MHGGDYFIFIIRFTFEKMTPALATMLFSSCNRLHQCNTLMEHAIKPNKSSMHRNSFLEGFLKKIIKTRKDAGELFQDAVLFRCKVGFGQVHSFFFALVSFFNLDPPFFRLNIFVFFN